MTYHYKATFCSMIYTCQYVQSSKETKRPVQQGNVVMLIFLPLRSVMCVSTKSNTQKLHKPRFLYISVMSGVLV